MEKEKRIFVAWVKEHEKELIIAGVSITTIIAIIIGIKNHKALEEAWIFLRKLVEKTPEAISTEESIPIEEVGPVKDIVGINIVTDDRISHDVVEHLRNLPEGWKASVDKIETAAKHGYDLMPGQTWVKAYRIGDEVA